VAVQYLLSYLHVRVLPWRWSHLVFSEPGATSLSMFRHTPLPSPCVAGSQLFRQCHYPVHVQADTTTHFMCCGVFGCSNNPTSLSMFRHTTLPSPVLSGSGLVVRTSHYPIHVLEINTTHSGVFRLFESCTALPNPCSACPGNWELLQFRKYLRSGHCMLCALVAPSLFPTWCELFLAEQSCVAHRCFCLCFPGTRSIQKGKIPRRFGHARPRKRQVFGTARPVRCCQSGEREGAAAAGRREEAPAKKSGSTEISRFTFCACRQPPLTSYCYLTAQHMNTPTPCHFLRAANTWTPPVMRQPNHEHTHTLTPGALVIRLHFFA